MGNYIYKISFIQKKSGKHNEFVLDNSSNFPNNPLKPDCAPSPKLWRRRKGTCPVNPGSLIMVLLPIRVMQQQAYLFLQNCTNGNRVCRTQYKNHGPVSFAKP
jgi:hypothetical protein